MSHWNTLKHLAQKYPITTMCHMDINGYPHMNLMHILESDKLGRFVISISKSSQKYQEIKGNQKGSWTIGSLLGEHAELSGDVEVLEFCPENEALFKEVWSEVLTRYGQEQMSAERVLLVMNARDIKIISIQNKVVEQVKVQ
ncbi:Conserved_hypothetical protein [Hexamita inflata]|uniref:Pyridoxamine 5'-phosphate oxidase N-terminal domain-containing protein n=1 Tax=Hexamita inflata TaxID=28002 RepID=A0AA86P9E3_9EUKA|nr:Conserved hypothetical protein [Hexamita inflata]